MLDADRRSATTQSSGFTGKCTSALISWTKSFADHFHVEATVSGDDVSISILSLSTEDAEIISHADVV